MLYLNFTELEWWHVAAAVVTALAVAGLLVWSAGVCTRGRYPEHG